MLSQRALIPNLVTVAMIVFEKSSKLFCGRTASRTDDRTYLGYASASFSEIIRATVTKCGGVMIFQGLFYYDHVTATMTD